MGYYAGGNGGAGVVNTGNAADAAEWCGDGKGGSTGSAESYRVKGRKCGSSRVAGH